jgi:tetratricopeptide (TPR) repeat protein
MLSVALYWEGEALALLRRHGDALQAFERSVAIGEALAAADTALSRSDLDFGYVRIADMLAALGRDREALEYYGRTLASRRVELAGDRDNLWKRFALIESATRMCRSLAASEPATAPPTCAEARDLLEETRVDTTSAADLGYLGGAFTDLGDAYERVARAARAPRPERDAAAATAHALHTRSYRIWSELAHRGVISPVDTARVTLARQAVARTAAPEAAAR